MGRFLLEGYIDLFACSLLNAELFLKMDVIFTNFSDTLAYLFAIVFLVLVVYLPIKIANIVARKVQLREAAVFEEDSVQAYYIAKDEKELNRKWSVFYENYKDYCNWSMLTTVVYVIRRMLLVMMALFWFDLPAFQLMGNAMISQYYMMFNTYFRPYKDPELNKLDFINDMVVVIFNYLMFALTDFV